MSVMSVDAAMLTRFAGQQSFSWMASLRPIRIWSQVKPTKQCCGQKTSPVPPNVIQEVVRSPVFAQELVQLKQRLRVDRLVINIHGYRSAV